MSVLAALVNFELWFVLYKLFQISVTKCLTAEVFEIFMCDRF